MGFVELSTQKINVTRGLLLTLANQGLGVQFDISHMDLPGNTAGLLTYQYTTPYWY